MARASHIQTNFTAGELSPRLLARIDISKYFNGLKTCKNFKIKPHGGAFRREGTVHVTEVSDSTKKIRLIPFEFSTTQAYVLEFGEKYIRFFRDNGQITDSKTITGATQANPCVVTAVGHGYLNGDEITISGVVGMTELNGNTYTIANVSDDTFELSGTDSTAYTAYSSAGTAVGPYSIITPYTEQELFSIQFAQSADVMWLVHRDIKPQKLSRTGHTSWSMDFYAPTADKFPGTSQNITGITAANPAVVTIAGHNYSDGQRVSLASIGGMTELNGKTYTIANTTTNTFELESIDSTGYTAYTSGGTSSVVNNDAPGCVTFYEQRLCFARSTDEPHKFWMSKSADYEDLTTGTADDDALEYTIASGKVNAITWMTGSEDLLIGTSGSEHRVSSSDTGPVTPTNIRVKRQTTHKCAFLQPVQIDNTVVYLQRALKKIRELSYRFETNTYSSVDLTILSEHITGTGITEMDYQQEPDSTLWAVKTDGGLIGLTYEKPQEVIAWHDHAIGGDGFVESVAVIPAADHDQIWLSIKYTINGSTVRYIEYFHSGIWTDVEDAFYVDSGLTYSGSAVRTVSGLDHLEGETVQVLADGARYPDAVVTSGAITYSTDYETFTKAQIGLGYESKIVTLEPEAGNPMGTAQGKTKSWGRIKLRRYNTIGGEINGTELDVRDEDDLMGSGPALETGDLSVSDLGHSSDAPIEYVQNSPFPATILGLFGDLNVGDD